MYITPVILILLNLKMDSKQLFEKQLETKEKKGFIPTKSIKSVYSSDVIHIEQGIQFSNSVSDKYSTIDIS